MADLPADGNVTADGDYDIKLEGGIRYNVIITGDFGFGTVTVGDQNPLKPDQFGSVSTASPITSNFSDVLKTRDGTTVRFTLSGSTSPDLYISATAIRNG